jgi:hypothetical protein
VALDRVAAWIAPPAAGHRCHHCAALRRVYRDGLRAKGVVRLASSGRSGHPKLLIDWPLEDLGVGLGRHGAGRLRTPAMQHPLPRIGTFGSL